MSETADPIDLLDAVWTRLEQAQSITLMMAEQIDRLTTDAQFRRQLAAELSAVTFQISEAQTFAEHLSHQMPLKTH